MHTGTHIGRRPFFCTTTLRQLKTSKGECRGARGGKAAAGVVVARSVFEQGMETRLLRCRELRSHRRLRLPRLRPRAPPAGSGWFRRKWAPISPWVLGFCAVFGGGCSLPASPTWGNAGVEWRFGLIRPAKPPRSLQMGFACVEGGTSNERFGPGRCWLQALRLPSRAC